MESREQKLAQARLKLRQYQDQKKPSPSLPPRSPPFFHDEIRSPFNRVRTRSESSPISSINGSASNLSQANGHPTMEETTSRSASSSVAAIGAVSSSLNETSEFVMAISTENARLQQALNEARDNQKSLNEQLQQLHGYYTQLHGAYESLSSSIRNGSSSSSSSIDMSLQQTVAVLVEEKTQIQSQLRQMATIANSKATDVERLQMELKGMGEKEKTMERELALLRAERQALDTTLSKQKEELEVGRRKASQSEAKVFEILQDRNDAQARLKAKCLETVQLSEQLNTLRQQLSMQDIYIKQLSHHAPGMAEHQAVNEALLSLNAEKADLTNQLGQAKIECERWAKEAQTAKLHYEQYGRQLNEKIVQLSTHLDELSSEKMIADSRIVSLEGQLEMANAEKTKKLALAAEYKDVDAGEDISVRLAMAHLELVDTQRMLTTVNERVDELEREGVQLRDLNTTMTTEINELRSQVEMGHRRGAFMEEQLNTREQCSEDSRALVSALQSEKATVSRAVAQNRELKDQLCELQERFIVLSEQAAEQQTRADSLAHSNAQLSAALSKLQTSSALSPTIHNGQEDQDERHFALNNGAVDETLDDLREDPYVNQHRQDSLERELAVTRSELFDCRQEATRALRENEELHLIMEQNAEDENQNSIRVELNNALERINALNTDNARLRGENEHLLTRIDQHSTLSNRNGDNGDNGDNRKGDNRDNRNDTENEGFNALRTSFSQLESRFVEAMRKNADLVEQNFHLEHLITQLQSETDTIGEYVTIYQHQRKTIRDRLRERDSAVARLSRDKENIQKKLTELQNLVMRVLGEKGLLHVYEQQQQQSNNGLSHRGRRQSRSPVSIRPRSFSHSTVDEILGEEQTLIDGSDMEVPLPLDASMANESPSRQLDDVVEEGLNKSIGSNPEEESSIAANTEGVDRILRIIAELQDSQSAALLPIIDPNLHCRECRGKLITL